MSKNRFLTCENGNNIPVVTELLRRLYLPLYLPILALIVSFLVLSSKNKKNHRLFKLKVFITSTLVLIISELSLNYSGISFLQNLMFIFMPLIIFISSIIIYNQKLKSNY